MSKNSTFYHFFDKNNSIYLLYSVGQAILSDWDPFGTSLFMMLPNAHVDNYYWVLLKETNQMQIWECKWTHAISKRTMQIQIAHLQDISAANLGTDNPRHNVNHSFLKLKTAMKQFWLVQIFSKHIQKSYSIS